jgi:hypothetical protein
MKRKTMMIALLTTILMAGAVTSSFAAEGGAPGAAPLPGAVGSTPGAGRPGPTMPKAGVNSLPSTTGSVPRSTTTNPVSGGLGCGSQKPGAAGVNPNC